MYEIMIIIGVFLIGFELGDYRASLRHKEFLDQLGRVLDGESPGEGLK